MSAQTLNRLAVEHVARVMRAMSLRPDAWGGAEALEMQARALLSMRRILLGAPQDERTGPGKPKGVYPVLHFELFGESAAPACALVGVKERAGLEMGDFIAEWWRREQIAVPDHVDRTADEMRLASTRARIACLPLTKRAEARRRRAVSWNGAAYAEQHFGCSIIWFEVVWPDGDRWPWGGVRDEGGAPPR